jgi:hypothetical protein
MKLSASEKRYWRHSVTWTGLDTRVITIPKSLIQENMGLLIIELRIKDPKSPAELGLDTDSRRLGLGLISLRLGRRINNRSVNLGGGPTIINH